ncbi:hypothetical protein IJI55_00955 [Candidatus Saccharibacteria bacterium]|nr:hypothetical protein [Candidatus Saccharibacteria bacterium]
MSKYSKVADITVKDGTYEKDGKQRNRYQNVGCIISTPHGSHMFIKLNATADHDARVIDIRPCEGMKLQVIQDVVTPNDDVAF